jgi:hypothetical protein
MDYLKGAIQSFVWEDNKTVQALRRFSVSLDWNGYLWNTSLYANVLCKQRVKDMNNRTTGE